MRTGRVTVTLSQQRREGGTELIKRRQLESVDGLCLWTFFTQDS